MSSLFGADLRSGEVTITKSYTAVLKSLETKEKAEKRVGKLYLAWKWIRTQVEITRMEMWRNRPEIPRYPIEAHFRKDQAGYLKKKRNDQAGRIDLELKEKEFLREEKEKWPMKIGIENSGPWYHR